MYALSFCVVCIGAGMVVAVGISDRSASPLPSSPLYFKRHCRFRLFENGKKK